MLRLPARPAWHHRGACVGLPAAQRAWFFSDDPAERTAAKAICQRCEVVVACLDQALADPGLKGVWGGTSETQRHRERSRRSR